MKLSMKKFDRKCEWCDTSKHAPALEHSRFCPTRKSFYGVPYNAPDGKTEGEIRTFDGVVFIWSGMGVWMPH